jgi:predicted RNase H-like nuclease (RuvC/YqgF family)
VKVFGIDVVKGSVRSRSRRPVYALVRMEDGEITAEGEVTLFRLLKEVRAGEPEILAVDSLQEISRDQHELFAFLEHLPPKTRLVQVTGGERPETLGKVAARYNISFDRFDPYAEARAAARIASLGGGAEVVAYENSCSVVVSRNRSLGKGGWSQNRYVRKVHGAVLREAREIEERLLAAGLRYEKKESRAFGGLSRVQFLVHAPREEIPVSTRRGGDVQVRVAGQKLDRIRFKPAGKAASYLIVGIDPGTTTAVAAVDLDGNMVHLSSGRERSMADVVEALYQVGKPLVVASDVSEIPFSVERIRRAFSAVPYTPREDRTGEEKMALTQGFSYANLHERDALSAALDAYRSYRNRFQPLLKRVPAGVDLNRVKAGIIRGQSMERILGELSPARVPPAEKPPEPVPAGKQDERVMVLDGMVKRLRGLVTELQDEVKAKEGDIARLRERLDRERTRAYLRVRRDAEIAKRDAIIRDLKHRLRQGERQAKSLKKRLERERKAEEVRMDGSRVPLKVLPSLTRDGVQALAQEAGIAGGDLLYVARSDGWGRSVVKDLAGLGVAALLVGTNPPPRVDPLLLDASREEEIPVLPAPREEVQVRGPAATVARELVEAGLRSWEEAGKKVKAEKEKAMVEYLFREYRTEREKEVRKGG